MGIAVVTSLLRELQFKVVSTVVRLVVAGFRRCVIKGSRDVLGVRRRVETLPLRAVVALLVGIDIEEMASGVEKVRATFGVVCLKK